MSGKITVYGLKGFVPVAFMVKKITILIDGAVVGRVGHNQTIEIPYEHDCFFSVKNMLESKKISIEKNMDVSVQVTYDPILGKVSCKIVEQKATTSEKAAELEAREIAAKEAVKEQELARKKEHRMRCNVCGKIFCYTQADLDRNASASRSAAISSVGAVLNAFAGTAYHAYEQNKMANSSLSKVVDYSKCPACNSSNLSEMTDEEWNDSVKSNYVSVPQSSAADELKKFKELLDLGAITQEEFDAKKKQLLGL